MNKRAPDAGVTMIEVLIVLVLVGISAATVGLQLNAGDREQAVDRAARLLATRLQSAADRALVTGQTGMLAWDDRGYRFDEYSDDAWSSQAAADPDVGYDLPDAVVLAAGPEAQGQSLLRPDMLIESVLKLEFSDEQGNRRIVVFDGVNAVLEGS